MKAAIIAAIVSAFVAGTTATAASVALITGAEIKNGSIQLKDLSPSARLALKGQRGPRGIRGAQGEIGIIGPPGPQGPAGAPGAKGSLDPSKVSVYSGPEATLAPGAVILVQARCGPGQMAISGAAEGALHGTLVALHTYPSEGTVQATIANDSSESIMVWASAVCVAP
jgi:Collagen triple helix repeat (20 copies)